MITADSSRRQLPGEPIVPLEQRPELERREPAVAHDDPAVDHA
jgi:hypothetical protein